MQAADLASEPPVRRLDLLAVRRLGNAERRVVIRRSKDYMRIHSANRIPPLLPPPPLAPIEFGCGGGEKERRGAQEPLPAGDETGACATQVLELGAVTADVTVGRDEGERRD